MLGSLLFWTIGVGLVIFARNSGITAAFGCLFIGSSVTLAFVETVKERM